MTTEPTQAQKLMWEIPEDTIVTYFLMRYGPELKELKVNQEGNLLIAGSSAQQFVKDRLTELLTPKYRIALTQIGCTNESWRVGFKNMQLLVLIAAAKMRKAHGTA